MTRVFCSQLPSNCVQVDALAAIIALKRAIKVKPEELAQAEIYHGRKHKQLLELREATLSSEAHLQIATSCR